MTQDKSDKKESFALRAERLRAYAKKNQLFKSKKALAEYTEISRAMLYAYLDGSQKVSDDALRKLSDAEIRIGMVPPGEVTGNTLARFGMHPDSSVKLNPAFAPPVGNPTQQDCIDHLSAYLAEAKHVPGLVAHTLIELKKHFKVADARAQREDV